MNKIVAPPGWSPSMTETRFVSAAPSSYDPTARTVEATISNGSAVQRFYGTEVLRIDDKSVILDRLTTSGIPILDSHQQVGIDNAVGRLKSAWISRGALIGKIAFNDTPQGRSAEGMVARGEITGVSAGYQVRTWEIRDEDGKVIDPEVDRVRWDDNLTFEATSWVLLEASLVAVPADATAAIRSLNYGTPQHIRDVRARMEARQRMHDRHYRLRGLNS